MKIISLVGARPQFIKEAVLNRELKKVGIEEVLVNSGQHYDYNMAGIFFDSLSISPPKYNLAAGSGKHGAMTGMVMTKFEEVVEKELPDLVLVYGDTNTTLAGALVAAKMKIPVVHVEAGVRMLPKDMPEEINRVLVDHISSILFCCSDLAVQNLKREGIIKGVHFVGDVMYDLFLDVKSKFDYSLIEKLNLRENDFTLVTLHRDYNVDDKKKLKAILKQLQLVNNDLRVVFPMHPRTVKNIANFGLDNLISDLTILDPVDYLQMMGLLMQSRFVITDSGGVQKESFFSGKRSFVVMPDPAWRELVKINANILCNGNNLYNMVDKFGSEPMKDINNGILGKGNAAQLIAKILIDYKK